MMTGAKIKIVNNETGEARYYQDDYFEPKLGHFMWTDGNFACDCNRSILFARAGGFEVDERECGDSLFTVPHAEMPDGQIIELDG